ncbi:glycerophosphodiester phosphodiesterase family protein [Halorubellus sp. PRR65]|uniref:glycerophosphodiester phosphodiesterase n=1 Tax=Halorubellus sp. PRR65 TaxID=3098148 RepID=UPI002B259D0A|nr:glycerophosphodiester phosphodiesterase family protein [Halorubellus sp. PRR65]
MQLVAHRGFAREAPENTLAAVAHAADAGANAVEVDVRAAADGTPVVVHDATVDRVADASGPVSEFDPDQLGAMDVSDSGEGVPTLDAVLELASDRGLAVNVEVKEVAVAAAAVDVVHDAALPTTAVWASSFDADALARVGDATAAADGPDLDTAYLAATRREDPVAVARECDCTAVHPAYDLVLAGDLVERAHAAGLDVYAWTLDSPWVARVVANRGVDGLISDVALDDYRGVV